MGWWGCFVAIVSADSAFFVVSVVVSISCCFFCWWSCSWYWCCFWCCYSGWMFLFPGDLGPSFLQSALMAPRLQDKFGDWASGLVLCVAVIVIVGWWNLAKWPSCLLGQQSGHLPSTTTIICWFLLVNMYRKAWNHSLFMQTLRV